MSISMLHVLYIILNLFSTETVYRLLRIFLGESNNKISFLFDLFLYYRLDRILYQIFDIAFLNFITKIVLLYYLSKHYNVSAKRRVTAAVFIGRCIAGAETIVALLTTNQQDSLSESNNYDSVIGVAVIRAVTFIGVVKRCLKRKKIRCYLLDWYLPCSGYRFI